MWFKQKFQERLTKLLLLLLSSLIISSCSTDNTPAIELIDQFILDQKIDKTIPDWKLTLSKPPKASFADDRSYFWDLETNKGNISIKLKPEVAPMHVSSTIYLTKLGFYDGVTFHRVIPGFMAQGGDPTGTGAGSPGYKYSGEFDDSARHNKAGILSMANAGPDTDGSQFFLTFKATPNLDGGYTVFGEVVSGMETLKEMEKYGSSPTGKTSEKLEIITASIRLDNK